MSAAGACVATACLDRAVGHEFELVEPRAGVMLDGERIQHRPHRLADHRLAVVELAERAALRDDHQRRNLEGDRQRGEDVRQRRNPLVCISSAPRIPPIQAPLMMPSPSSSRVTQKSSKNGSSVHSRKQRLQHVIRHVGDQPDLVGHEHLVQHIGPCRLLCAGLRRCRHTRLPDLQRASAPPKAFIGPIQKPIHSAALLLTILFTIMLQCQLLGNKDKRMALSQTEGEFLTLHELVRAAHKKLDRNTWDYLIGGTGTETTVLRKPSGAGPDRLSSARAARRSRRSTLRTRSSARRRACRWCWRRSAASKPSRKTAAF